MQQFYSTHSYMAARNSPSSYSVRSLVTLLFRHRALSGESTPIVHHSYMLPSKVGYASCVDQGLKFISASSRVYGQSKMEMANNQPDRPPSPAPSNRGFTNWLKWLLGSILPLLLSLWKKNLNGSCSIEGKAERVVEEVEEVAEVVERAATTTDKMLIIVTDQLPDGSKLKEAALAAEHVSSTVAYDAQYVEHLIHKVEDLKQDLEDLDTMVKPIVDNIIDKKKY